MIVKRKDCVLPLPPATTKMIVKHIIQKGQDRTWVEKPKKCQQHFGSSTTYGKVLNGFAH